jgi:hypothetical protein
MAQLFVFIVITIILGVVLWPFVWVFLLLTGFVGFVGDAIVYRATRREADSSPDGFRTILFLQGVFICVIYALFFATVASNIVANKHPSPSWPYPFSSIVMMFLFIALINGRVSRRDQQIGATVGIWAALIAYAFFYRYPQILDSVPRAVSTYERLVLLTNWLMDFWPTRDLLFIVAGGFLLIGAVCVFFLASVGLQKLARKSPAATMAARKRAVEGHQEWRS